MRRLRLGPPRTLRLRLALLYGSLFLATGLLLLAITYALVAGTTPWTPVEPPDPVLPSGPAPPLPGIDLQLAEQRHAYLRLLLVASGVALALMTVLSVWLGWLMAGRALRPLRAMAETAREISASDLHRRLGAPGPSDEIKELADTFDALLDRLESAFEAQRRFVANASHELRTPLTFERALLEITLADPDASAADLRAACERVLAGNEEQEKLIEALLTLARSQRGLDRRVPLDLAVHAGECLELARPEGLHLTSDLAPAPATGDPSLVARLIGNLVDNALRHNTPGGSVLVRTSLEDGLPTLRVRNTGPVIRPDQLDLIFQPFQRLGSTRLNGHEGQGIGLSIVTAIASAHHAALTATPLPEGGLDIRVSFPAPRTRARTTPAAG